MAEARPIVMTEDLQRILKIPLEAIVVLAGKEMTMREVLSLRPGTIIEFEKSIITPFELVINNRKVAAGVAVKVGEKFGMKIATVQPVERTVKAMGLK